MNCFIDDIMRLVYRKVIVVVTWGFALFICLSQAKTDEFRLTDGTRIWGRVANFNEQGVVFRLDAGGFSESISWSKFDQDSLKKLAQDPKLRVFAEPFIEIPPETRPKPKSITIREPPKVLLPQGPTGLGKLFTIPIGLMLIGTIYIANLLAAYEIAKYRNRPIGIVCALAAILPGVTPVALLLMPAMEETQPAPVGEPVLSSAGSAAARTTSKAVPVVKSGLRLAGGGSSADVKATFQKKVYDRSKYNFDREFIEREFRAFFSLVRNPAEKELILIIRTPKQEIIVERISRISPTDIYLVPIQSPGTEIRLKIGEISQMIVKHKDDRSKD